MELHNFLNENNLSTFDDIKDVLVKPPYLLFIKEDTDYPNLYMITYKRGISNLQLSLVRECRGIILEKDTNKLVCYTFNNTPDIENYRDECPLDWEDIVIEESIDGTQIKLFYYNDRWNVSTTRCIDARKSKWFGDKSFFEMYLDVYVDYSKFNQEYCYGFVLKHPDNKIVVNYNKPELVHIITRSLEYPYNEVDMDINISKPKVIEKTTYEELVQKLDRKIGITSEGFMLKDSQNNRVKLFYKSYLDIKELRGNTSDPLLRYLELVKDNLVSEYLAFYPEYSSYFAHFSLDFKNLIHKIHTHYMKCRVFKTINQKESVYKGLIYELHGNYLKTHEKTTYKHVEELLNNLHPKVLYYFFNV